MKFGSKLTLTAAMLFSMSALADSTLVFTTGADSSNLGAIGRRVDGNWRPIAVPCLSFVYGNTSPDDPTAAVVYVDACGPEAESPRSQEMRGATSMIAPQNTDEYELTCTGANSTTAYTYNASLARCEVHSKVPNGGWTPDTFTKAAPKIGAALNATLTMQLVGKSETILEIPARTVELKVDYAQLRSGIESDLVRWNAFSESANTFPEVLGTGALIGVIGADTCQKFGDKSPLASGVLVTSRWSPSYNPVLFDSAASQQSFCEALPVNTEPERTLYRNLRANLFALLATRLFEAHEGSLASLRDRFNEQREPLRLLIAKAELRTLLEDATLSLKFSPKIQVRYIPQ